MLSFMLFEDKSISSDPSEVYRWARAAAEHGVVAAMTRLGMLYHNAIGVDRDPAAAVHWWRRAAERDDADAQAMLGAAYHLGSGAPADQSLALVYLLRGQAGGSVLAVRFLEAVRAKLSPEAIADAERQAQQNRQDGAS